MFEVVTYNKTLPSEFFMEIFEIPTKGFFKNESDTLLELSVNSMKLLTARYIYIYIYLKHFLSKKTWRKYIFKSSLPEVHFEIIVLKLAATFIRKQQ